MITADLSPLAAAAALDRQISDMEIELSKLREQRDHFVKVAIKDGITDDGVYELKTKTRRSIDARRFRALYPAVYDDIAVISATAAEKILGKELLREAVRTRYQEKFIEAATVNIGDAEKRLGKSGLPAEVVITNTVTGSVRVVRKGVFQDE